MSQRDAAPPLRCLVFLRARERERGREIDAMTLFVGGLVVFVDGTVRGSGTCAECRLG